MPEGDTIHRAAARIREVLEGRVPREILTPHPRHRPERWPERLRGRMLAAVDAHGKHLFLRFDGGLTIHSHLRMSGSWLVCREGERWRRARSSAWLVLREGGWEVVQFGGPVLELIDDRRARSDPRVARMGPDVLGEEFDVGRFLTRLRSGDQATPVGDALLDQRTLAGIGNVWKSEACFAVGVDPWRPLRDVHDEEALAVVGFARERMHECVREGHRARPHAVYRRAGRPCPRCGAAIRARAQGDAARTTFWCPRCQS